MTKKLWFDVESRLITTNFESVTTVLKLWFDVESRLITTICISFVETDRLWFDVESRLITTTSGDGTFQDGCGLM